jgi:hypothetical protein
MKPETLDAAIESGRAWTNTARPGAAALGAPPRAELIQNRRLSAFQQRPRAYADRI